MRIAVLSDIHGNLEAFTAVLADVDELGPESIVCLGDTVGYGPDPEACLRLLRARNIPSVMGNHEQGLVVPEARAWFNPTARTALSRTEKLLSKDSLLFLSSLPTSLVMDGARFVHGMPPDNVRSYFFEYDEAELARVFQDMVEDVCFIGHTHMLETARFDGASAVRRDLIRETLVLEPGAKYIVNGGSVGQPRDDQGNDAKYVVYDGAAGAVQVRFVPYDHQTTIQKILALGMPEQYARRLA